MSQIFDIVVIGAGPAGANAALTAAWAGCRVAMVDEQRKPGGQVWRAKNPVVLEAPTTPESRSGDALRQEVACSTVLTFAQSRVWQIESAASGWEIYVLQEGKVVTLVAKALILATGAREYVQPVPGWTTPGVIGLAGATAMFKQDLALPGQRTVVSGTGPLVFFVASEIRRLGGEVAAVVTPNSKRDWLRAFPAMVRRPDLLVRGALWVADLYLAGVPIYWRHAVAEVDGETDVSGVTIRRLTRDWAPDGEPEFLGADSLCLGNGLTPAAEAAQLAGLELRYRADLGGWCPEVDASGETEREGLFLCGDGAGIRGAAAAEIHGKLTGETASAYVRGVAPGENHLLQQAYQRAARFGMAMTALSVPRKGLQTLMCADTVVCRCESLTRSDIVAEINAGAQSTLSVKSGLRAGMGPCGGKFCQGSISQLIAQAKGGEVSDVPPPTARPPLRPIPVAALAGDFEYDDLPIPKPAPL